MRCYSILVLAATAALASAAPQSRFRGQVAGASPIQSDLPMTTPPSAPSDGNTPAALGSVLSAGNERIFHSRGVSLIGGIMATPAATTATPTLGNSVVSGRGTRAPTPPPTKSTGSASQTSAQANANDAANTRGVSPIRGVALSDGIMNVPAATTAATPTLGSSVVSGRGSRAPSHSPAPTKSANANTASGFGPM